MPPALAAPQCRFLLGPYSCDDPSGIDDIASLCLVLRGRRPQSRLEASCTRTGRPRSIGSQADYDLIDAAVLIIGVAFVGVFGVVGILGAAIWTTSPQSNIPDGAEFWPTTEGTVRGMGIGSGESIQRTSLVRLRVRGRRRVLLGKRLKTPQTRCSEKRTTRSAWIQLIRRNFTSPKKILQKLRAVLRQLHFRRQRSGVITLIPCSIE